MYESTIGPSVLYDLPTPVMNEHAGTIHHSTVVPVEGEIS
jgi:hypothetical protein